MANPHKAYEEELLGLTNAEHRIFQEILDSGETPLGAVIKKLGLHKGTAYNSIRRLQEKGLVGSKNVNGVNVYSINPFALKASLTRERTRHEEHVKKMQYLLSKVTATGQKQKEAKIQVLVGQEGFKSFLEDLYSWAARTRRAYLFLGKGDEVIQYVGEDYYKLMSRRSKKLRLNCRLLLATPQILPLAKDSFALVRYLSLQKYAPTSIWIYGDTIALVLWDAKPLTTLVIASKEAASNFKNYFESLWSASYGPKMTFESRHKINLFDFINKASHSLDVLDIVGFEPLHEGRNKIVELLKKNKRVRVLLGDPSSENSKNRVFLEERQVRNLKESRIFFEWKSALANLKDIYTRANKTKLLEVRLYDEETRSTTIILDGKELLYNPYRSIKGEYASDLPAMILNKDFDENVFTQLSNEFEKSWASAKIVRL